MEQRQYSRFDIKRLSVGESAGLGSSVITIKFVTDSSAAVTASNTDLNINDSGIYRQFYTSGKPFSDARD